MDFDIVGESRLVSLALPEIRQDIVVAPAVAAHALPLVVVVAMAPHVQHGVQHRAAAQHLSRVPLGTPVRDAGHGVALRLDQVIPVVGRCLQSNAG